MAETGIDREWLEAVPEGQIIQIQFTGIEQPQRGFYVRSDETAIMFRHVNRDGTFIAYRAAIASLELGTTYRTDRAPSRTPVS